MLVSLYEFYICYKLKVIITTDKKRNIEERKGEDHSHSRSERDTQFRNISAYFKASHEIVDSEAQSPN